MYARLLYLFLFLFSAWTVQAQYEYKSDLDYYQDRAQIIKINGLALSSGNLSIAYEKALRYSNSVKLEIKYIGLFDQDYSDHYEGVGINLGYKIKYAGIFLKKTINQISHIFHGGYFQPNMGFNLFNIVASRSSSQHRLINIGIDCGRQWVIKNRIALDLFIGMHYVVGSNEIDFQDYSIGDIYIESSLGVRYGIQLGYLFGNYGNQQKEDKIKRLRQLRLD